MENSGENIHVELWILGLKAFSVSVWWVRMWPVRPVLAPCPHALNTKSMLLCSPNLITVTLFCVMCRSMLWKASICTKCCCWTLQTSSTLRPKRLNPVNCYLKSYGSTALAFSAPDLQNSLHDNICSCDNLNTFKVNLLWSAKSRTWVGAIQIFIIILLLLVDWQDSDRLKETSSFKNLRHPSKAPVSHSSEIVSSLEVAIFLEMTMIITCKMYIYNLYHLFY